MLSLPGRIIFLFLSCAFFTTACSPAGQEGAELRVVSFNIAAGNGDIGEIARVIEELDPDIVGLQEVDVCWGERSNFENQIRYLGEVLEMNIFFGEIYTLEPEDEDSPPRQYGLAFLSKEPITDQENHLLSRLSTQTAEPELVKLPGFPEITVQKEGQTIHFFNTHLDYRRDPSVREKQTREMMELITGTDGPVILTGDLNARPGSDETAPLFERLHDTWVRSDDPGYTYPAGQPDRRIDYILHSDHFEVHDVFVVKTEASDHRPVVADLVLSAGR